MATGTMDATLGTPAGPKTEGDVLTVNEGPSPIEEPRGLINPPSVGGYKGTFARVFVLSLESLLKCSSAPQIRPSVDIQAEKMT